MMRAALALGLALLSVASARRAPALLSQAGRSIQRQTANRTCSGTGGDPTDYAFHACFHEVNFANEVKLSEYDMTLSKCFTFCQTKKVDWFGVTKGTDCLCMSHYDGAEVKPSKCDEPCRGNKQEMCGSEYGHTSVYVTFDCTPPTPEEIAAEKKAAMEKLLKSYNVWEEQTCGQGKDGNKHKVNGKETMIGSVDECKVACMEGTGSLECHGFTYEEEMSKCTWHTDVMNGKVLDKKKTSCYFKK
eukprot:gnl/TRDRNA2_/TRDRNA2_187031_c0_seq1.p1 gnl/TRDRNA2_/TRDRNA2_187031_c0~~gnl/TRDRNA2_/TRDRNA2_187031_c0_seq1.p1  ORF type:complete len:245 (+),score=62.64 gnl/TRDRNA2_/TRDRNA2_187031_c0_seq1:86-820(+)